MTISFLSKSSYQNTLAEKKNNVFVIFVMQ